MHIIPLILYHSFLSNYLISFIAIKTYEKIANKKCKIESELNNNPFITPCITGPIGEEYIFRLLPFYSIPGFYYTRLFISGPLFGLIHLAGLRFYKQEEIVPQAISATLWGIKTFLLGYHLSDNNFELFCISTHIISNSISYFAHFLLDKIKKEKEKQ